MPQYIVARRRMTCNNTSHSDHAAREQVRALLPTILGAHGRTDTQALLERI